MGVDCRIELPPETRMGDIATAIAALAGIAVEIESLGNYGGVVAATKRGAVKLKPLQWSDSGGTEAQFKGNLVDGETGHTVILFPQSKMQKCAGIGGPTCVALNPPSTPFWCAIGHGLVNFFGGSIDYNDCDDTIEDYAVEKPRPWNNPDNGPFWNNFQRELAEIDPVIPADFASVAAYKVVA